MKNNESQRWKKKKDAPKKAINTVHFRKLPGSMQHQRPRDPGDSKLVCKPLHLACDLYTAVRVDLRTNRKIWIHECTREYNRMVETNIDGENLLPSVGKTWNNLYVPVSMCFAYIPMGLCNGSLFPSPAAKGGSKTCVRCSPAQRNCHFGGGGCYPQQRLRKNLEPWLALEKEWRSKSEASSLFCLPVLSHVLVGFLLLW